MTKAFKSVSIEANDDGTFQLEVVPFVQVKKGQDSWDAERNATKKATCNSLEQIPGKIKGMLKMKTDKNSLGRYLDGPNTTQVKS